MIFSRWVSLTVTALLALDAVSPAVLEGDRNLQDGKGKGKGKGKGGGGCPGPLVEFESEVLVDFDGFDGDPREITRIDWDGLEIAFRDSYNALSDELCDDLFRKIIDVKIQVNNDGEILIKRGGAHYSLRYHVTAVCRGCNPNTVTLFSPPAEGFRGLVRNLIASDGQSAELTPLDAVLQPRRRTKSSKDESKSTKSSKKSSKSGSSSGDDDESCDCDSENPEYRAPTEDEFRVAYDAAIMIFRQPGSYRRGGVAVDCVVKVTEVEDVSCSVVVEEFMVLVSVEFFGDREAVTDEERAVLEENFVQVYNGLQAGRCDAPLFRTVTMAEIVMVSDQDEPMRFMYIFAVTGTCRGEGCSENITLFQMDEFLRMLQSNIGFDPDSECQCPVFGNKFGPPSTDDFEVRYFQVVQDLKEIGRITNIDASGEVMELPADVTPVPTNQPTPAIGPSQPTPAVVPSGTIPPTRPGDTFAPSASPSISSPVITFPPFTFPPTGPGDSLAPSEAPSEVPSNSGMMESDLPSITLEPTANGTIVTIAPSESSVSEAPSSSPSQFNVTEAPSSSPSQFNVTEAPSSSPSSSPSQFNVTDAPTPVGTIDGLSGAPSISAAPTVLDGSEAPSSSPSEFNVTEAPTPVGTIDGLSGAPSISAAPTVLDGSEAPSSSPSEGNVTEAPTAADTIDGLSGAPSISAAPTTQGDSEEPSVSQGPSSQFESAPPSVSPSMTPSGAPSSTDISAPPAVSEAPSSSNAPSDAPSSSSSPSRSSEPSTSAQPSR